ncbi:MAG TPA: transcriptional regulator [Candidatus Evtepia faecavium]|nr:transcriptional regulator [Candidatus Evtepia faecavium]
MELSQIPAAFQSKLRLAVVAALLAGPKNFRALQDLTGATPGNLGKQLEVLEAAGFLASQKAFVGRRPNTTYRLLPQGREQFAQYVALLEGLLAGAQEEEGPAP